VQILAEYVAFVAHRIERRFHLLQLQIQLLLSFHVFSDAQLRALQCILQLLYLHIDSISVTVVC